MISPWQWIHGVEWIWLIWLAGLVVVLQMTWRTLRCWRRPRWAELARGEEGLSYSLSYMLVFPLYLLFVCMVFETSLLLVAKIGTVYAAHAGARSAVVWSSAKPESKRNARIYQSVWTAMTPFVTGNPSWTRVPPVALSELGNQSGEYVGAYQVYQRGSNDPNANAPLPTLGSRFLTAASRTIYVADDNAQTGDLTLTVTYRAPLHIPGAASILARGATLNEYEIKSSATLPSEAPANDSRTLGIDYVTEVDH